MAKASIIAKPGKLDIVVTRVFNAPRKSVFKAYTTPELIPKWWGSKANKTTVDKLDVRPGGGWRFVQTGSNGNKYSFSGVFHSVKSPERLVYTMAFESMPENVLLETVTFKEYGGGTKLTITAIFQTVDDRDSMIRSGMKIGLAESMNQLADLLIKSQ